MLENKLVVFTATFFALLSFNAHAFNLDQSKSTATPVVDCTFANPTTNLHLSPAAFPKDGGWVVSEFSFPSFPDGRIMANAHSLIDETGNLKIHMWSPASTAHFSVTINTDGQSTLEIEDPEHVNSNRIPIATRKSSGVCARKFIN